MTTSLDNYDLAQLVDLYADTAETIKALDVRLGEIRARIKSLAPGRLEYVGASTRIDVSLSERMTLDKQAVTIALGKTWVENNSKQTFVESWRARRQPRIRVAA